MEKVNVAPRIEGQFRRAGFKSRGLPPKHLARVEENIFEEIVEPEIVIVATDDSKNSAATRF